MKAVKTPKPLVADISADLFRVAALFTTTKKKKCPALRGVRVERHPKRGVVIVATDGTRLFAAWDRHGKCNRSFTLDAKGGLGLAPRKRNQNYEARWELRQSVSKSGLGKFRGKILEIDDPYPNWRGVCDAISVVKSPAGVVTVDASLLATFLTAARLLTGDKAAPLHIMNGKRSTDPLLIKFSRMKDVFGLLMPMLMSADLGVPAFFDQLKSRGKK